METMTYKEYLEYLLENATEKKEIENLKSKIKEIDDKIKKMTFEDISILKMENMKNYFSLYLVDEKEKFSFWVDCSLIDGYGNRENYKTPELYVDWEYNQYIFYNFSEHDIKAKEYQENGEHADRITACIDEFNNEIIDLFKKGVKK